MLSVLCATDESLVSCRIAVIPPTRSIAVVAGMLNDHAEPAVIDVESRSFRTARRHSCEAPREDVGTETSQWVSSPDNGAGKNLAAAMSTY